MKNVHDISELLKKKYFWDTDLNKLDPELSKKVIIERIFRMGDIHEMKTVMNYYGNQETLNVLRSLNYLDPKTLNFVSKLFNEPRENFLCHARKQSTKQHWSS